MQSDQDIKKDVENELQWSPYIDASDIAVTVEGGIVELAGYARSFNDKFEAEWAAKRVLGVAGIANDIEVRLPDFDQRPDPDIARDAISALDNSLWPATLNIRPIVKKGWVTLDGSAEWYFQKERAESTVRRLRGVKGVTNLVQLKPYVSPTQIKQKIEAALKRNAALDASHITVSAAGGVVTLEGSVRSWLERQEAENAAWAAPGVTSVDDRVSVSL